MMLSLVPSSTGIYKHREKETFRSSWATTNAFRGREIPKINNVICSCVDFFFFLFQSMLIKIWLFHLGWGDPGTSPHLTVELTVTLSYPSLFHSTGSPYLMTSRLAAIWSYDEPSPQNYKWPGTKVTQAAHTAKVTWLHFEYLITGSAGWSVL